MAGHSHWANIKRKKEANDKKKAKVYSKAAKMILAAIREGGPNPDTNQALRIAIEYAKQVRLPKDNIERLIKRQSQKDVSKLQEVVYEGFGPGKIPLLIKVLTDNTNRTLTEIRTVLNRKGGELANKGAVIWQFEQIGKVVVSVEKDKLEEFLLDVLDNIEVLDTQEKELESGQVQVTLIVKRDQVKQATDNILKKGYHVIESGLDYLFTGHAKDVTEEDLAKLSELKDTLEDLDDVNAVWLGLQ